MYELGEQFKPDLEKALSNESSVIKGNKFRITILSESLFRFEYNESGTFNDMPTEIVLHRNLPKPDFEVKQDIIIPVSNPGG